MPVNFPASPFPGQTYTSTSTWVWDGSYWNSAFVAANLVTTLDTQTITNKTISGASNTVSPSAATVTTATIVDANVTTAKLADSSVTSAKIADGAILDADINASAAIAQSKISGLAASLAAKADIVTENISSLTISGGVLTVDASGGYIAYVGTAPSANFTVNVTNATAVDGKSTTINLFVVQGATGYIPNALQVGGTPQTIRWAGGTAPTPTSTVGKIDSYAFSLLRVNNSWIVLGSTLANF